MSARRLVGRCGLLVLACLAAGCGGTEAGEADPQESAASESGSAPSSTASGSDAPRVESPLEAAGLVNDPCSALSTSQVQQFGYGTGRDTSSSTGPACSWNYADEITNRVNVGVLTGNKNGIGDIYAQRAASEYFEPTEVAGYPAVFSSASDRRDAGRCTLHVGISDQVAFNVFTQLSEGPGAADPCPVAEKVAEAVVHTLQGES